MIQSRNLLIQNKPDIPCGMSGLVSAYGLHRRDFKKAIDLSADARNGRGGLNGRKSVRS